MVDDSTISMTIPEHVIFVSQVIGAILVILGMLGSTYKWVVKPIIHHFTEVKTQFLKLDAIYEELKPNHGSSIKDAINQIRHTVHTIEKRQRAWLSYEDQGIFETDADGKCIWVNRAYLKMLNVTFEEVQGNGWKNFIHPHARENVFHEWASAVVDKRDCKIMIKYLNANNEEICASMEAFAIKNEANALTGYVGVITIQTTLDKCA